MYQSMIKLEKGLFKEISKDDVINIEKWYSCIYGALTKQNYL